MVAVACPVSAVAADECGLLGVACSADSARYSLGIDYGAYSPDAVVAPYLSDSATVDLNVRQLREALREDPQRASEAWLIKVSGGWFGDRSGATSDAWDYSVEQRQAGTYQHYGLIDPGTYNYAATGRVVLDQILRDLGFADPEWRDALSYPILLAGAGVRQVGGDLTGLRQLWGREPENRHLEYLLEHLVDGGLAGALRYQIEERTWYGEDRADVRSLEMGFAHSQLLDIQRIAGEVGVPFDLSAFGYRHASPSPYRLLDESAVLLRPD